MPRASINIRVKGAHEIRLSEEGFRRRRRGEILHLALSFVKTAEDLPRLTTYVKKALVLLGEKFSSWDLTAEFVRPLEHLFSLPEARIFFTPAAKEIFRERSILLPWKEANGKQVLRPDRMVLFEDRVVVVDFKSELSTSADVHDEYREQVKNYAQIAERLFGLPAEGYLLFILTPKVEKVY